MLRPARPLIAATVLLAACGLSPEPGDDAGKDASADAAETDTPLADVEVPHDVAADADNSGDTDPAPDVRADVASDAPADIAEPDAVAVDAAADTALLDVVSDAAFDSDVSASDAELWACENQEGFWSSQVDCACDPDVLAECCGGGPNPRVAVCSQSALLWEIVIFSDHPPQSPCAGGSVFAPPECPWGL